MNLAVETLQTHLYARIRDESGNKMNICTRLECCVNNECVAVFEGHDIDLHYYVLGASFQVFAGRKLIRTAGAEFSFSEQKTVDRIDRFEIGYHTMGHLIRQLYMGSRSGLDAWRLVSMNQELFDWLETGALLDPHLLSFICAWQGERRVY